MKNSFILLLGISTMILAKELTITTIFDNTTLDNSCETEWGFACVLEFPDEKILFDTGNNGDILVHNMKKLDISPTGFSKIIISHNHWDHIGGLDSILKENKNAAIFLVKSTDQEKLDEFSRDTKIVQVDKSVQINEWFYSTGELESSRIPEQSLAIKTKDGIVIITGCAHPGLEPIVEKSLDTIQSNKINLLMGGFHLHQHSDSEISHIINYLKSKNVNRVSPTHCTGENAIKIFKESFGESYVLGGVGFKYSILL